MLALSPPFFPTLGWPLLEEYSINHEHVNNMFIETETSNSQLLPLHSPQSRPWFEPLEDAVVEKKLNHNASERERRKKVNKLYYSLRSLLPPSDQTV